MASEAQKRANAKYRREKIKQLSVQFYPDNYELYDFAKTHGNVSEYIRQLIRQDMERS